MITAPRASAFVRQNQLCLLGAHETKYGIIPFTVSVPLSETAPDGPVDMGLDLDDNLTEAFRKSQAKVRKKLHSGKIRLAVETLVIRARAGDQNAIAMLGALGIRAKQGVKRAKLAFNSALNYIKANPAGKPSTTSFGLEKLMRDQDPMAQLAALAVITPLSTPHRAIVLLANSGDITPRLAGIIQALGSKRGPAFKSGYRNSGDSRAIEQAVNKLHPQDFPAYQVGYAAGRARRLQHARTPEGRISAFSPGAGWELGE